jgi:flagellar protein FlgJ
MSNAPVGNASFYADFGALTALKKDVKANDPQALRAAAQQFESLFTDMMLKAMRDAKLSDGLGESQATDFYQDMYDQQLTLQMSQGKGLGLADLLVQQLTRGAAAASASGAGASSAASTPSAASSSNSTDSTAAAAPPKAASAPPAAANGVPTAQRIDFIRALAPYAQRAAAQLGISPDGLIAQAALETGWGRHVPRSGGVSSNNLFGIKAEATWGGGSVQAATTEYQQAVPAAQLASFRAYSSLQQGVNDYVSLLRNHAAYQSALGTGADVGAFANALQRGGYATDPDYVAKLTATAAEVQALRPAAADALNFAATAPTTSGVDPA